MDNNRRKRVWKKNRREKRPFSTMPHITLNSHFARKCCGTVCALYRFQCASYVYTPPSIWWDEAKKHSAVIHIDRSGKIYTYIFCSRYFIRFGFWFCTDSLCASEWERMCPLASQNTVTECIHIERYIFKHFDAEHSVTLLEHAYLNMVYLISLSRSYSLSHRRPCKARLFTTCALFFICALSFAFLLLSMSAPHLSKVEGLRTIRDRKPFTFQTNWCVCVVSLQIEFIGKVFFFYILCEARLFYHHSERTRIRLFRLNWQSFDWSSNQQLWILYQFLFCSVALEHTWRIFFFLLYALVARFCCVFGIFAHAFGSGGVKFFLWYLAVSGCQKSEFYYFWNQSIWKQKSKTILDQKSSLPNSKWKSIRTKLTLHIFPIRSIRCHPVNRYVCMCSLYAKNT